MSAADQGVVMKWINGLLGRKTEDTVHSSFKALGNGIWVAAFTNNFQDLHGEILSGKAHDKYLARVKLGLVPMPELWHWHKEGTKHGETLWMDKVGDHFVVAVGRFDDSPAGRAAEAHYKIAGPYTLSHGFRYPEWALKAGVYEDYNTFEITTLPPGREANPYTSFEEIKQMALNSDIKDSLTALFGAEAPDIIKAVEGIEEKGGKVRELGVKFKDFADALPGESLSTKALGEGNVNLSRFVSVILKDQADSLDLSERTLKALSTVSGQVTGLETQVKNAVDALAVATKALEDARKDAPRSVTDATDKSKVKPDDPDAKDGPPKVDEKSLGADEMWDPMFPGMGVKMKKPAVTV